MTGALVAAGVEADVYETTLTIPAGHYRVSIVREFDHISGTARFVVD